jgi:inner membrane protein
VSDLSMLQSSMHGRINPSSMGLKLSVVCGLALLMTVPALFVGGLVDDRTKKGRPM